MDRHILFLILLTAFFLFTTAVFVALGEERLEVYLSVFTIPLISEAFPE